MSTKKLNRTEARAKNFKTVFGKKAKRLAVRRGVKAPVLTRADFAMQRHTIEGLRDELGREVLRRQDRESRITHLDKEIAGIGEMVKKATNEGFERGQRSMKCRALNIAHKIAVDEGKAPGSSWSGRVEANLNNLLIQNIFDVSIHEYADEKTKTTDSRTHADIYHGGFMCDGSCAKKPKDDGSVKATTKDQCCERDYDHDGNCDRHPEKDRDPRGCPEPTKPAFNLEVWQKYFDKLLENDNVVFAILRDASWESREDSSHLSDKAALKVMSFISKLADNACSELASRVKR